MSMHLGNHEKTDISVRAVFWFGGIVAIGIVVTAVVIAWLQVDLEHAHSSHNPLSRFSRRTLALPEPSLQTNPTWDMKAFRMAEDAHLNSFGWVDRKAGIVRVPVDRAMEAILQRGLPRSGPAAAPGDVLPTPAAKPTTP